MTTDTDKASDKLVDWLDANCHFTVSSPNDKTWELRDDQVSEIRAATIADLCGDVEPVAWGIFANNGNIRFWACDKASADSQAAKTGGDVEGIFRASTVAALKAERDAALARTTDWKRLYDRAINEANGLTNYVEDRPELRSAERRLDVIAADARALKGQP